MWDSQPWLCVQPNSTPTPQITNRQMFLNLRPAERRAFQALIVQADALGEDTATMLLSQGLSWTDHHYPATATGCVIANYNPNPGQDGGSPLARLQSGVLSAVSFRVLIDHLAPESNIEDFLVVFDHFAARFPATMPNGAKFPDMAVVLSRWVALAPQQAKEYFEIHRQVRTLCWSQLLVSFAPSSPSLTLSFLSPLLPLLSLSLHMFALNCLPSIVCPQPRCTLAWNRSLSRPNSSYVGSSVRLLHT